MDTLPEISDSQVFAKYAGSSLERWNAVIGYRIRHVKHNSGAITEVKRNSLGWIVLLVRIDKIPVGVVKVPASALLFKNAFIETLPPEISREDVDKCRKDLQDEELQRIEDRRHEEMARLAQEQRVREEQERKRRNELLEAEEEKQRREAIERQRLEEQARQDAEERQKALEREASIEFALLKGKYSANTFPDKSATSPLNAILLRMENDETLLEEDLSWLKRKKVFGPLAHFYERQFELTSDVWTCVHASACWRGCGLPEESLYITEIGLKNMKFYEPQAKGTLLTTRGGAFRDLRRLDEAEDIGLEAISINPGAYYPYNLIGAVYYQMGQPEKGDDYFSMAVERGAQSRNQDSERRHALDRANEDEQIIVANYLLQKDPQRFAWAGYYLPTS